MPQIKEKVISPTVEIYIWGILLIVVVIWTEKLTRSCPEVSKGESDTGVHVHAMAMLKAEVDCILVVSSYAKVGVLPLWLPEVGQCCSRRCETPCGQVLNVCKFCTGCDVWLTLR